MQATDDPTLPAGAFIYLVKQLELALRGPFHDACAAAGMSGAQFTALSVLERWPNISSSELARRSFMRSQSMAQTLEPLLDAGLVQRREDPTHRRRLLLSLTELGGHTIRSISPRIAQLEEVALGDLPASQRDALIADLRRVRRTLAATPRTAPPTGADDRETVSR